MSTVRDPYYAKVYAADPRYAEIQALPDADLIERFRVGVENFDRRVFALSDDQLDLAFLPEAGVGRWPVRVLLGHLADAELLYVHRMRRTVGEDQPLLAVWDENAAIDAGLYHGPAHNIGAFVATIHTLRRWTGEWLATLTPEQLQRRALHPERGEMSIRKMLQDLTWHLEHHSAFLNAKIERLLGPDTSADQSCGPACGCHAARPAQPPRP